MLYFKSCLRCKDGTVELGSDNFGSFLNCLTCGYTINSRSIRSNGSIEQPVTPGDDVMPVPAPVAQPVAVDSARGDSGEIDVDDLADDFVPDPDVNLFEDEFEELVVEEEATAI